MNTRILIFCIVLLLFTKSLAQFPYFQSETRSLGMANIHAVNFSNWSGCDNPSGLAGIKEFTVKMNYFNYYQISELGTGTFNCVVPTGTGNFGAGYFTFAYSGLRQNLVTLAYGKSLGESIKAGIGINYLSIIQPRGYTSLSSIVPSLGLQLTIFKNLLTGISVFNPVGQSYNPAGYLNIPVVFTAGIAYEFGDELVICFETEKITDVKLKYRIGVEFSLNEFLFLRCGIIPDKIKKYTAGIGIAYKTLKFDLSVIHHPVLGFSPSIGLTYIIKHYKAI